MIRAIRQARGLCGPDILEPDRQPLTRPCPQCAVHELQIAARDRTIAELRETIVRLQSHETKPKHETKVGTKLMRGTKPSLVSEHETKLSHETNETKPTDETKLSAESPVIRALNESLENSKMAAAVHVLGKAKGGRPSQGQPWLEAGMSKSQWYRQRKSKSE